MKRKALAIMMAFVLALSASVMAFAKTTDNGQGTVWFIVGDGPVIIDDIKYDPPTDEDDDSDKDFDKPDKPIVFPDGKIVASSRNISFGERVRSTSTQKYSSLEDGFKIKREERVTGVAIDSPDRFFLTVAIGHFMHGGEKTISGFNLTLVKQGADTNHKDGDDAFVQETVKLTLASNTEKGIQSDAALIFNNEEDTYGIFAGHWSGELEVPGGAVEQLDNHGVAVMVWVVSAVYVEE